MAIARLLAGPTMLTGHLTTG